MPATFIPRSKRTDLRTKAYVARRVAEGSLTSHAWLEAIDVAFGTAAAINSHKITVERFILKSYGHPEVRARFRFYTDTICARSFNLDQACALLRAECAARHPGERARLPSMVRSEFCLILRWMRRKKMHAAFAEMVAAERHRLLRQHIGAIHQGERVLEAAE